MNFHFVNFRKSESSVNAWYFLKPLTYGYRNCHYSRQMQNGTQKSITSKCTKCSHFSQTTSLYPIYYISRTSSTLLRPTAVASRGLLLFARVTDESGTKLWERAQPMFFTSLLVREYTANFHMCCVSPSLPVSPVCVCKVKTKSFYNENRKCEKDTCWVFVHTATRAYRERANEKRERESATDGMLTSCRVEGKIQQFSTVENFLSSVADQRWTEHDVFSNCCWIFSNTHSQKSPVE